MRKIDFIFVLTRAFKTLVKQIYNRIYVLRNERVVTLSCHANDLVSKDIANYASESYTVRFNRFATLVNY